MIWKEKSLLLFFFPSGLPRLPWLLCMFRLVMDGKEGFFTSLADVSRLTSEIPLCIAVGRTLAVRVPIPFDLHRVPYIRDARDAHLFAFAKLTASKAQPEWLVALLRI